MFSSRHEKINNSNTPLGKGFSSMQPNYPQTQNTSQASVPSPNDDEEVSTSTTPASTTGRSMLPPIENSPERNVGGLPFHLLHNDIFSSRETSLQEHLNRLSTVDESFWASDNHNPNESTHQDNINKDTSNSSLINTEGMLQPTVVYKPALPPGEKKKALARKIRYAMDNFFPPGDTGHEDNSLHTEFECKVCKYLILAQGEYVEVIKKIYRDHTGFFRPAAVFNFIKDYWNQEFAGVYIQHEPPRSRTLSTSTNTQKDRCRKKSHKRRRQVDNNSQANTREYFSTGSSEIDTITENDDTEDSDIAAFSMESSSGAASTSDQTTNTHNRKRKRYAHSTRGTLKVPEITASEIEYHFTECYREDNPKTMLIQEVQELMVMKSVIYNNGLFCKRVKSNNAINGADLLENQATQQSKQNDATLLSEFMAETVDVLKKVIHEDVLSIKELKEQGRMISTKLKNESDMEELVLFMEIIKDKEHRLRCNIEKYEKLKNQSLAVKRLVREETVNTQYSNSGLNQYLKDDDADSDEMLCLKIKETCLFQTLSKTIAQLLRQIDALNRGEQNRPIGVGALEYYKTLGSMNHNITSNDKNIMRRRIMDFAAAKGINRPSTVLSAFGHYCNQNRKARDLADYERVGEFVSGATAAKNRQLKSMAKASKPRYTGVPGT